MKFMVRPYKDSRGKWHRDILGPLQDGGTFGTFETCHAGCGVGGCDGFVDEDSAKADGMKRIEELCAGRSVRRV